MSQKRWGVLLLMGSLLLVTPFMVSFSQGIEKSIFSAMATLSDVKETLEQKRALLTGISAEMRLVGEAQRGERREVATKQFQYARDVYRLARGFLDSHRGKHPKYQNFWARYSERLDSLWTEIEDAHGKVMSPPVELAASVADASGPAAAPAREPGTEAPVVAAGPAPAVAAASAEPPVPAPAPPQAAPQKKDVLDRYREAYQLFTRGSKDELAQASGLFAEILADEPTFHLARYWLARTLVLESRLDEARTHADRLLAEQPNLQIARDLVRDVAARKQALARGLPVEEAGEAVEVADAAANPPAAPASGATQKPAPAPARAPASAPALPALPALPAAALAAAPAPVHAPAAVPAPPAKAVGAPARPSRDGEVSVAAAPAIRPSPVDADGSRARPLAVMIENSKFARPQSGLALADLVYEVPVEGGITRFMAVFMDHSRKVDELGPVRSARHYFVKEAPVLDAIYIHCGGSNLGYAAIAKERVDAIDEIKSAWGFWRNKQRKAPHNLYTKLANLVEHSEKKGFRLTSGADPAPMPVAAASDLADDDRYQDIVLPFYAKYVVRYTWDPVSRLYARFINDEPHVDAALGQGIAVENVVVVQTGIRTIDEYGRLDLELVGEGTAQVFRGGKSFAARWQRTDKKDKLEILDPAGRPIAMNPGRVWIHTLADDRKVAVSHRPMPAGALAKLNAPPPQVAEPAHAAPPPPAGAARTPGKGVEGVVMVEAAEPGPRRAALRAGGTPGVIAVPTRPGSPGAAVPKAAPAPRAKQAKPAPPVESVLPPPLAEELAAAPEAAGGDDPVAEAMAARAARAAAPQEAPKARRDASESRTWQDPDAAGYDLADFSLETF